MRLKTDLRPIVNEAKELTDDDFDDRGNEEGVYSQSVEFGVLYAP